MIENLLEFSNGRSAFVRRQIRHTAHVKWVERSEEPNRKCAELAELVGSGDFKQLDGFGRLAMIQRKQSAKNRQITERHDRIFRETRSQIIRERLEPGLIRRSVPERDQPRIRLTALESGSTAAPFASLRLPGRKRLPTRRLRPHAGSRRRVVRLAAPARSPDGDFLRASTRRPEPPAQEPPMRAIRSSPPIFVEPARLVPPAIHPALIGFQDREVDTDHRKLRNVDVPRGRLLKSARGLGRGGPRKDLNSARLKYGNE